MYSTCCAMTRLNRWCMSINIKKPGARGQGPGARTKKKTLRSGFTTGACAAAAAKAAAMLLLGAEARKRGGTEEKRFQDHAVEIPFPDRSRVTFRVQSSGVRGQGQRAWASVIKDAGDDPDVTNGVEIVAEAKLQGSGVRGQGSGKTRISINGGKGVGTVTKPGLPIPVGEPAINPVPRRMIEEAVHEAISDFGFQISDPHYAIELTISVPKGEELAKKTLNHRLGIVGGISILGTTGIVKPVSAEAWTATITSSMNVARASGCTEVVLSAGRTSEKAHMKEYGLPEEAYVLMGDYLEYSLQEARQHEFKRIYLCAQWAKMVKIAMATPQTHVRFGVIDIKKAVEFLNSLGIDVPDTREFNTAREIFDFIVSEHEGEAIHELPLRTLCEKAKTYAEAITRGVQVITCLVSYDGKVIAISE